MRPSTPLRLSTGLVALVACADGRLDERPGMDASIADAAVDPRPVGAPCARSVECSSAYCIPAEVDGEATAWPEGLCTAPCTGHDCEAGAACVAFADVGLCLALCEPALGCRQGYVCHPELQVCLPDCRRTWDCGERFECSEQTGACTLPETPGQPLGGPCVDAFDCVSLLCLPAEGEAGVATGWPGGLCTEPCLDGDCGPGGVCTRLGEHLLCVPACADVGGCRGGYVCNSAIGGCLPDCRAGWACADGFTCGADGQCELLVPPMADLGDPCAADYECDSGICLPAASGWPGGTCAGLCGAAACGEASTCVPLDGVTYCLPTCASPERCRDGYVCNPEVQVCLPDCRGGFDCGPSSSCSERTGVCEPSAPTGLPLASACAAASECESAYCLLSPSTGFDLGVCTVRCTTACADDLLCVDLGAETVCLAACASGCTPHFVCDGLACVPDCMSGWPCPAGQTCRTNGLCRRTSPGPGPGGR